MKDITVISKHQTFTILLPNLSLRYIRSKVLHDACVNLRK